MADGIDVTPGTGATVRTIDRGANGETQVMLLDVAEAGQAERLGLPPSRLVTATSAGLTTATTAYTAGDQLGTELSFTTTARFSAGGLQVVSGVLVDKADITGAVDLFLFESTVTPAADNAANAWSDADMAKCVGVISFPQPFDSANNRVAVAVGGLPLVIQPGVTTLFGHLVTRSAHTFFGAVTDLVVRLGIIAD